MATTEIIGGNGVTCFFTYTGGNRKVQSITLTNNGTQTITVWVVLDDVRQEMTVAGGGSQTVPLTPPRDYTTPTSLIKPSLGFEVAGVSAYGYHYD